MWVCRCASRLHATIGQNYLLHTTASGMKVGRVDTQNHQTKWRVPRTSDTCQGYIHKAGKIGIVSRRKRCPVDCFGLTWRLDFCIQDVVSLEMSWVSDAPKMHDFMPYMTKHSPVGRVHRCPFFPLGPVLWPTRRARGVAVGVCSALSVATSMTRSLFFSKK